MAKKNKDNITEIPEVKVDNKLISMYLTGALIGTDKGVDKKFIFLRRNIVRLVDKAIDEYSRAREAMIEEQLEPLRNEEEMRKEGRIIYAPTIINHLENCINSISRFFKMYDRLKAIPSGPVIDRNIRRIAETYKDEIKGIRDIIEHFDERIQQDQIQEGQKVALWVSLDYSKIEILDEEIKISDLVSVIHNIHKIGKEISQFKVDK